MKPNRTLLSLLALLLAGTGTASAQTLRWTAPAGADLEARALAAPLDTTVLNAAREPVSFVRALPADLALAARPLPTPVESREYWLRTTDAELERGLPLPTTAPGALLRLNPVAGTASPLPLDAARLTIVDARGNAATGAAAYATLADREQLAAAGAPFPAGTIAVRLQEALGAGTLTLRYTGAAKGEYTVHVFEPKSPLALRLVQDRVDYLHGGKARVTLATTLPGASLTGSTGFLTSPAGRAWPVTFVARAGKLEADVVLDAREAVHPGLWEVEVSAHGKSTAGAFLRNARTAFAVALPTARLLGASAHQLVSGPAGWTLRLGIETAAEGRYHVRAALFGRDATGAARPLLLTETAAWLAAGNGVLELSVPSELLRASGLFAPYEVRHLELADQSRMAMLHRQEKAAEIVP